MRIGLIQSKIGPDRELNIRKALEKLQLAAERDVRIACLSELFSTQYFCQTRSSKPFDGAETLPGPTTRRLAEAARRYRMVIIAPLFEKGRNGRYYNSACVLDADGKVLGAYRKTHIPYDSRYLEKHYFEKGNRGIRVFDTRYGRAAILICWDQWFPEAARIAALKGASVIFYPTAIGWVQGTQASVRRKELEAWKTIQISHAIANQVFVASVNRVGREGGIEFWGSSFIAGPDGGRLAGAGTRRDALVIADCKLSQIRVMRKNWPFYRDRRTDLYGDLCKRGRL